MQVVLADEFLAAIAAFLPFDERRELFALCKAMVDSPARRMFFAKCTWRVPPIASLATRILSTLTMKHVIKTVLIDRSWQQTVLAALTGLQSVHIESSESAIAISPQLPVGLKSLLLSGYNAHVTAAELGRLVNLEHIFLLSEEAADIEIIGTLPRLKYLTLGIQYDSDASIEWIEGLSRLHELFLSNMTVKQNMRLPVGNLEKVSLSDCQVPSLSFLMEVAPRMSSFSWKNSTLSDAAPEYQTNHFLHSLTKIEILLVSSRNFISLLDPLASLTTMKVLDLRDFTFHDLSPLAELVLLDELTIHAPNADWSPIVQCKKLRMINQSSCFDIVNDTSARALQQLPLLRAVEGSFYLSPEQPLHQITSLAIAGTDRKENAFEPGCCFSVENLTIWGGEFDVQSIAESFPLLKMLYYSSYGGGPDFGPLARLTQLERLSLTSFTHFDDDLRCLLELVNLESLYISSTTISDLSVMRNLKQLRYLELSGRSIEDISTLAELKKLLMLSIMGTRVQDISCLYGHPQLRKLVLPKCAVCRPLMTADGAALPNIALFEHRDCTDCSHVQTQLP